MVRVVGLEPTNPKVADFKSAAYTIPPHSHIWCPQRDSNPQNPAFETGTYTNSIISALVGSPADPTSVQIAQEQGLDLAAHRAQQVSSYMCQQAELILVMEQSHKAQLEQLYPQVRGKVFRLGQFGQFEIEDPYRQPREAFDSAYQGIAQGVADWLTRIRQLS